MEQYEYKCMTCGTKVHSNDGRDVCKLECASCGKATFHKATTPPPTPERSPQTGRYIKPLAVFIGLAIVASTLLLFMREKRIDASSNEAMRESIEAMKDGLSREKSERLDEAMKALLGDKLFSPEALLAKDGEGVLAGLRRDLDGKTVDEVIQLGESIRERREKKSAEQEKLRAKLEREQALQEIAELSKKRLAAHNARGNLAAFRVTRSRYTRVDGVLGKETVLEISVRNGMKSAVSRVSIMGTVKSPGREVPWIKERIIYEIPGGLEPGESADWKLSPNQFSDWGTVKVPADAILVCEPISLVGPKISIDGEGLSEFETERLSELCKKYGIDLEPLPVLPMVAIATPKEEPAPTPKKVKLPPPPATFSKAVDELSRVASNGARFRRRDACSVLSANPTYWESSFPVLQKVALTDPDRFTRRRAFEALKVIGVGQEGPRKMIIAVLSKAAQEDTDDGCQKAAQIALGQVAAKDLE